jgi:hypothetical protein
MGSASSAGRLSKRDVIERDAIPNPATISRLGRDLRPPAFIIASLVRHEGV